MKKIILTLLVCLLPLSSCGGGGRSSQDDVKNPNPPAIEHPEPTVGLAIFGLLNQNFPVNDAIELLSVSERPAFSFPNKTFGENPQNYITLVDALESQGKSPYVGIYAICGPCRVPRRDGRLVEFRQDLDIPQLNWALANDPITQQDYKNFLTDMRNNLVSLYPDLEYDIYPELESNMNFDAQEVAITIAREVFADMSNVRIIVNPLDNIRHPGVPLEIHTDWIDNISLVGAGDIISLDGQYFRFPGERGVGLTFEETKEFIRMSKERNVLFYLWRFEWQGLYPDNPKGTPEPDKRIYKFLYKNEIKELLLL